VLRFYRVYHSSRYVGDRFALRLLQPLSEGHLAILNDEFARLVEEGCIEQSGPLEGENDHLDLVRLSFVHTRHDYALLRRLIDRINELPLIDAEPGTGGEV
jgi:hypothetical protein